MHCFMDGRDVDPQAGAKYVDMIQKKMDERAILFKNLYENDKYNESGFYDYNNKKNN